MDKRDAQLTRRQLLRCTALGTGSLILGSWDEVFAAVQPQPAAGNKYFLALVLQGAADTSYMWDARPLAMTAAGKIQNWWTKGDEPIPYAGVNGQTCLRTPLVEPLMKFRDRMTVLNGVHMSATFDGHLQNMNFLFCGSAFGGESFVPHLNLAETGQTPASLDGIAPAGGGPNVDGTNMSRIVPLEPKSIAPLGVSLQQVSPLQPAARSMILFCRACKPRESSARQGGFPKARARCWTEFSNHRSFTASSSRSFHPIRKRVWRSKSRA
jgi:hypothetical protein